MHVLVLTIEWSYYVHGTNAITKIFCLPDPFCDCWLDECSSSALRLRYCCLAQRRLCVPYRLLSNGKLGVFIWGQEVRSGEDYRIMSWRLETEANLPIFFYFALLSCLSYIWYPQSKKIFFVVVIFNTIIISLTVSRNCTIYFISENFSIFFQCFFSILRRHKIISNN